MYVEEAEGNENSNLDNSVAEPVSALVVINLPWL